MGITEHAQALLGDMVFVELPSEGDEAYLLASVLEIRAGLPL
jgi:glycine cleavage system H lipoate-binding protein